MTKWATICTLRDGGWLVPDSLAHALMTLWTVVRAVKTYRDILTTDVIHIRRPDGQGLDAFMHAGPQLPEHQGFALVFNPTLAEVTAPMTFPLYYTGESRAFRYLLNRGLRLPLLSYL